MSELKLFQPVYKDLIVADELLPGYIDRCVASGSLSPEEAEYIRENKELIELLETPECREKRQEFTLDEYFVIAAIKESNDTE